MGVPQWLTRLSPNMALNHPRRRKVFLRRIGRALKSEDLLAPYLGTLLLGLTAGMMLLLTRGGDGAAAETSVWFFRNATELNAWFILLQLGAALWLLNSYNGAKNWKHVHKYVLLPFVRMVGDALILAFGAYLVAFVWTFFNAGGIRFGQGADEVFLTWRQAGGACTFFLFQSLLSLLFRLIAEGPLDEALLRNVEGVASNATKFFKLVARVSLVVWTAAVLSLLVRL